MRSILFRSSLVLLPLAAALAPAEGADDPFSLAAAPKAWVLQTTDCITRIHAHAAAFADFDEDGDGDVVQAMATLGLGYAENLGGDFTWKQLDALAGFGTFNTDVAAGDFDADGHQDLALVGAIVGNPGQGVLRILSGDGKGSFAPLPDVPLPGLFGAVLVGNLDGDGRDDVVVTYGHETTAVVRLGTGAVVPFDLGLKPFEASLTDVDQNGADDLVVRGAGATGHRVLFNDGAGGVAQTVDLGTSGCFGFLAADVDGDGDRDVVTTRPISAAAGTELVQVENLGGAQFGAPKSVPFLGGFAVATVLLDADLDDDGDVDLLIGTGSGSAGALSVLRGDGAGGFTHDGGASILAEDLWWTDAAIPGETVLLTGDVQVIPVGPDGRIGGVPLPTPNPGIRPIAVVDVDGDGLDDLTALNLVSQSIETYVSDGERGFATPAPVPLPAGASRIAAADLDGNGVDDLVVWGSGGATGVRNAGGALTPAAPTGFSVPWVGFEGAVGDVDGDGRDDLVLAQKYEAAAVVGLSNGDGTFSEVALTLHGPPGDVRVTDVDGDGLGDLVYASKADGSVRMQRALGGGAFAAPTYVGAAGAGLQLDTGDVDGDGDADVVVGTLEGFEILSNDGAGAFTNTATSTDWPFSKGDLHLVDMNGDGALDVQLFLEAGGPRSIALVENTGGGQFGAGGVVQDVASVTGCVVTDSRPGDFDGDGLPDVAVSIHAYDGAVASLFVYFNDAMFRKRGTPSLGGAVELTLDAPASSGAPYLVLAGTLGRWPGVDLGADRLPLNPDPILWPLSLHGGGVFQGFVGALDGDGRGTAKLVLPAGVALGAPLPLDFAFVTLEAGTGVARASNAIELVVK